MPGTRTFDPDEFVYEDNRLIVEAIAVRHEIRKFLLEQIKFASYYHSIAEIEMDVEDIAAIVAERLQIAMDKEPF